MQAFAGGPVLGVWAELGAERIAFDVADDFPQMLKFQKTRLNGKGFEAAHKYKRPVPAL